MSREGSERRNAGPPASRGGAKRAAKCIGLVIAPGLFGLGDQVLRNAAMRQHEFRPAIRRRCQRDRGHREDAHG